VLRDTFTDTLTRATDATRQQVLESVNRTSHEALAGAYRSLLGYAPSPVLGRYPGPVLLVVDAENDSTFSLHAQEPSRPRRPVAETSHWVMLDQPDAVHAYLDDFLTILSAG
jgi:pimeloyl-ACP methyl ester carboxylesterase